MKKLFFLVVTLLAGLFLAGSALATERGHGSISSPAPAVSTSSSTVVAPVQSVNVEAPGAQQPANQITSRALGIGLSSAANPGTCMVPVLWGGVQIESRRDCLIGLSRRAQELGSPQLALEILCQDEDVAKSVKSLTGQLCGVLRPQE